MTTKTHTLRVSDLEAGDKIVSTDGTGYVWYVTVEREVKPYPPGTVAASTNGFGAVFTRFASGEWYDQDGHYGTITDENIERRTVKIVFDPRTDMPTNGDTE